MQEDRSRRSFAGQRGLGIIKRDLDRVGHRARDIGANSASVCGPRISDAPDIRGDHRIPAAAASITT
jgi:hypothetical protein